MKKNKGFTLIEVLITVTIIGIMTSVSILSYKNYIKVSNESATKQELMQVAQAFEIGVLNGDFTNSDNSIEYTVLETAYEKITGYELPFSSDELSYDDNVLTLVKRDVIFKYDFNTKAVTLA